MHRLRYAYKGKKKATKKKGLQICAQGRKIIHLCINHKEKLEDKKIISQF